MIPFLAGLFWLKCPRNVLIIILCICLPLGYSTGAGTFADPVTIAGYKTVVPVGARVYVPHYKKYFVHEDECYVRWPARLDDGYSHR